VVAEGDRSTTDFIDGKTHLLRQLPFNHPLQPPNPKENFMLGFLDNLIDWFCGRCPVSADHDEPNEPTEQSRWVVDISPRDAIRLGAFKTKQEAYDARREFIIQTLEENEPVEVQS